MTRLQINDNFAKPRLQTQATPNTPTVTAPAPIQETKWSALAKALAGGAELADQLERQREEEDRAAAKRYAQSMTVAELGRQITEGKMLPSQSPVFAATVQHIWGENSHEALQRDVISKITTGELKFANAAEADMR